MPLDDVTIFRQLIELAEKGGRLDLVEEFRRRATSPTVSPKPTPVPPAQSATSPSKVAAKTDEPSVLANEALKLLHAGKIPEAIEKFQSALALDPDHHDAHVNLGVAYGRWGRRSEAEQSFRQAIRIRPDYAISYGNLGTILQELNRHDEAEAIFRQAVQLAPHEPDFHAYLGNVLEARGQNSDAEASFRAAIALRPSEGRLHIRLGKLLSRLNRQADAEASFREATKLQPDVGSHWSHLGGALESQQRSADAEKVYRVAIGLEPNNPEFHNNIGVSLAAQSKYAEAEVSYRRAIELEPRMAIAHNNLGNNYRAQDRLDLAATSLHEALRLEPRYAEAHNNLGIVYFQQRQFEKARTLYDESLRLRPDYPEAHLNRSLMLLGTGEFTEGWDEYEWRLRMPGRTPPPSTAPQWDGSPLNGRRLLLRAEQGLGDITQFMRYGVVVPRGTGGKVILECPEPLIELAKTCAGIDELFVRGQPAPPFDVYLPLLSMPRVFKTNLATIPADIPYLDVDPGRVEYWREQLAALPGPRVGITWQGSLDHRGDHIRSVALSRYTALAKVWGITLCSLQKGHGLEQLTDGSTGDMTVHDFGSRTASSFADTAALMKALDLVISIDTAVAHVAGAIGVPVWVLIPYSSDWRWLQNREDSPWYPTMRLFPQITRGDWEPVFAGVARALQQWPDRLRRIPRARKS